MAEVRKKEKVEKYNIDDLKVKTEKKEETLIQKQAPKKKKKTSAKEKKGLWTRFRIFCHGVKTETGKVHWPSKADMLKYSIATIAFVVFCSLFFYFIEIIFAFVQSLFN